jgi:hypothetical protein
MDLEDFGKGLAQLVDGEVRTPAGVNEHLFPLGNEVRSRGDKFDHLGRHYDGTMAVGVDHVVGRNNHPGNTYDSGNVYNMNMDV